MNSITFTDLNKKFTVPGSYNELSRRQLLNIAWLKFLQLPDYSRKYRILIELFNVNRSPFFAWLFRFRLKPAHIVEMFPLAEFAMKEPDLTKNLIPSFRLPWSFKRWYGPDDYLKNINFREFTQTEKFYARFHNTGKVEYLDKLIAVLYRQKKKNYKPDVDTEGDCRERYNDFIIDRRAKIVAKLPINIRLAILDYYHGSRNYVFRHPSFQSVFRKAEKQKSKIDPASWEKAMMNMADKSTDIENIAYTKLYTILYHLNEKIEANKEAMKPFRKASA